jgi:uncharacterized lipoprotein YajG
MRQNLHIPLTILFAFVAIAPAAATQTTPAASAPPAATVSDDVTTGSIQLTEKQQKTKQFEECMALWDRDTHMTTRQWRRTCRRQLDEINSF